MNGSMNPKTLLASVCIALSPVAPAENIITLGDSLSFAYEAEFGFKVTIPTLGTYGDGFGPGVRNWIEVLSDPACRGDRFHLDERHSITVTILFSKTTLFFRQRNNWAIPGLRIGQLRRFIEGQATFLDLIGESSEFSTLETALGLSDFNPAADFDLGEMEDQIANNATRLTLFIGGNDLRGVYGDLYDGLPAGSFVDDFIDDAEAILDRVQELNPNLQIVVVNVPHIGITPDVKSSWPTDPVKTERVTVVVRELNRRLETLAKSRGLGYADIFTPTLPLIGEGPLCIHGLTFNNSGSDTGALTHAWLDGPISANFHPNTNGQLIVANAIIDAFNETYHTGIAPLTATEMLVGKLGKSPAEVDLPFSAWMTGHGLVGDEEDDSDGDGIPAGVEFALGLNPTLHDSRKVKSALVSGDDASLELAYPVRLPASSRYTLTPTWTPDLTEGFTALLPSPVPGPDGLSRARLPLGAPKGFLRLEATLAP